MVAEKKVHVQIEAKDKTGPLDSFLKSTGAGAGTCVGICLGVVIIVFVIAFLGGLSSDKTVANTINTETNQQTVASSPKLTDNNPLSASVDSFCPKLDVPLEVIPIVCTTCSNSTHSVDSDSLELVGWGGWKWEKMSSFYGSSSYYSLVCSPGAAEGENANYLYCNNVLATLTKSFADEQGTVTKLGRYYMEWVFVPFGDSYRLSEIQYTDTIFDSEPDCKTSYVP